MKKWVFVICFGLLPCTLLAQSAAEEALILNQELQFLEDSVSGINAAPATTAEAKVAPEDESTALERTYFSEEAQDIIRTKTAAPKRRRSF